MNKKEKLKLTEIYNKIKEDQLHHRDGKETYTNGYRWGHTSGQIELLEMILKIDNGTRCEGEK